MKIKKIIKSKAFKIYVGIGLLVYIIPFLAGITNAVRIYLEYKIIFPDYIEEIKEVYISEDKDIAMCVKGNTRGQFGIEYWVYIPYIRYRYSEGNFAQRVTGYAGISHDLIEVSSCKKIPWNDKQLLSYVIPIKYEEGFEKIYKPSSSKSKELFKMDIFTTSKDTMYVIQEKNKQQKQSKLVLSMVIDNKNVATLFNMSNVHYPEKLNPLWYLLYIPAFILDILLWPMYLMLFLYSAFIAPIPR